MRKRRSRFPTGTVFKRAGRWRWRFQWRGREYSGTLESGGPAAARATLSAEIQRVTRLTGDGPKQMTLAGLLAAWDRKAHDKNRVERVIAGLGPDRTPDELEIADIVEWAEARVQKVAPTTVRREVFTLSAMFQWAVARRLARRNPVRGAPLPPLERKRREGLSREEVSKLLRDVAGHPTLDGAYRLALFAGMRRAEIVAAQWCDVDFEARTLLIRGTKTDESYATVPLHPDLCEWLAPRSRPDGPILGGRTGRGLLPDALERARRRHAVDLPGFHLMRHTLATLLVRDGVDMGRVSRLLRHSALRTTEKFYAHLRPVDCSDELGRLKF